MWVAERCKGWWAEERGAALLEFTLVAWFFFITIFGVIEFSLYFWQLGAISKGEQSALRYAAVSNPVTGDWADLQPNSGKVITCRSSGTGTASCTPATNPASAAAMDCIVARVRAFAPFVDPANVVVEYRANDLGLSGNQAPTIQVRLENLRFMTIFLGFMDRQLMPSLDNTMTAEDASSSAPGSSTTSTACGLIS